IEQLKKIAGEVLGGRNANDSDAGRFAGGVPLWNPGRGTVPANLCCPVRFPCRAAGRPYAREVANQALCDAINNRVVAHSVVLQSLNGPVKTAHCRLTFMSL